jgi:hypothetical protein
VAGLVEQVGVDVEGRADAGVAEDPADLDDVEAQVDDQVAGEGVTEGVKAQGTALDLRDRVQAVVLAYESGLVTPG